MEPFIYAAGICVVIYLVAWVKTRPVKERAPSPQESAREAWFAMNRVYDDLTPEEREVMEQIGRVAGLSREKNDPRARLEYLRGKYEDWFTPGQWDRNPAMCVGHILEMEERERPFITTGRMVDSLRRSPIPIVPARGASRTRITK